MNEATELYFAGRAALLLCLIAASACAAKPDLPAATAPAPAIAGAGKSVTVFDDIPYRSGASPAWRLDLALPPRGDGSLRPAIVIVHGGGWRAGSKQDAVYRGLLLSYAFQGYVTVSIDYRLDQEAAFPACVADVKCAVKWVRAHARELGVDPDRVGTYGHSAGAHLALMLAMAPDSVGEDSAACDWKSFSGTVNVAAAGATPTEPGPRQQRWANPQWWPAGYVSRDVPPLLLLQGTADQIVDVKLVDTFIEKLKQAGAPDVQYVRVDGGTHGVAYDQNLNVTKPAMDAFFARTLRPGQAR